jgi:galactokinase/CTP:molybdopterin cytidylyltransferase MocA
LLASELKNTSSQTLQNLGAEVHTLGNTDSSALKYLFEERATAPAFSSRTLLLFLYRMYGPNEERLRRKLAGVNSLATRFLTAYGDSSVILLRAPARINILGEHVDYVSYLPTASLTFGSCEHDMMMLYGASGTDRVRGSSTAAEYSPIVFSLGEGPSRAGSSNVEADWVTYLYENPTLSPHWGNYVKGAAYFANVKYGNQIQFGFDFVVDSSVPAGGGASSSSALVTLASATVNDANGIRSTAQELARDAARAEWYVGTRGGAMDHTTICLARRWHAVLIQYGNDRARQVRLPGQQFRWLTFFSEPAEKGNEVMIEYNERAAVSRLLIPAVIEGWKVERPERFSVWRRAIESFQAGSLEALDAAEEALKDLPEITTLDRVELEYPETFSECQRSFPALVRERMTQPLEIRARALHHLGEVRRVALAAAILDGVSLDNDSGPNFAERNDSAMRSVGELLNQSHESLRDQYGVSTPQIERLVEIIRSDPNVYGARLMGGGFGGNVLALTNADNAQALIERVQVEYYAPQNRQGVREGSVMVSTPGDGLGRISGESVWRKAIKDFNSLGHEASRYQSGILILLDNVRTDGPDEEVWPVIVAAGKGSRARATGLEVPKPLAPVLGKPAIAHVIQNIRAAVRRMHPPAVIVSRDTEQEITTALAGEEVLFVVQPEPMGTGDAVLCANELMSGFPGRALIIWSTQPVIRPKTIERTLKLATLFDDYEMVLPTVLKALPYAPLQRDERGNVFSARETNLEMVPRKPFGESNIGMFLVKSQPMFAALLDMKSLYWDETRLRYKRAGNELGFPNELINYLATRPNGVFACPIADSREEQGIKKLEDVERCERFISEFLAETASGSEGEPRFPQPS